MSEAQDQSRERQFLRRLAADRRLPGPLRRLVGRIEGSNLAYRLAHGAFWSLAGTVLSRALTLAVSVVTARVLGKEGYGQLGVLSSTLLTFQAFAGLGLGMTATKFLAELRGTDPARAGRILALSSVVSTATGLLAGILLWVYAPWLAVHTIDAPSLAWPLRISAFGLFFTTLGGAQTGALAGLEAFRTSTWLNLWSGLLGVPIAVAGVWWWGLEGAVWATSLIAAVQWVLTHFAVRQAAGRHGIPVGLRGCWTERRVLWTFALPALAQGVMVAPVSWAASALLVNQPNGYAEMGAFSAANQWFGLVLFLPSALGGAILPVLSERVGLGDAAGARKVLKAAIAMNAAVVAPIILAGCLASPFVMAMYGASFRASWPTLVVVLVTAGVVATTNPVGTVLAASNRLWIGTLMNAGWAAVFLGTTVPLLRWGAAGVSTARLVAYAIHTLWTLWYASRFLRVRDPER